MTELVTPLVQITPRAWRRGSATYENGDIVLDRGGLESSWEWDSEVYRQLARVTEPRDAIDYVRRYGMLWHRGDEWTLPVREPWQDWKDAAGTMRDVTDAVHALQRFRQGDARRLHARVFDRVRGAPSEDPGAGTHAFLIPADPTDDQRAELVQAWIAYQARRHTQGTTVSTQANYTVWSAEPLTANVPGIYRELVSPTLEAFAYEVLINDIQRRVPFRECDECGQLYDHTDPRRRYCSKQCSQRARIRTHRQKKKEQP